MKKEILECFWGLFAINLMENILKKKKNETKYTGKLFQ